MATENTLSEALLFVTGAGEATAENQAQNGGLPQAQPPDNNYSTIVSSIAQVEATLAPGPSANGGAINVSAQVVDYGGNSSGITIDANGIPKQARPGRQGKQVPRWTPQEEERLKAFIGYTEPRGRWNEIAEKMGNGRSAMSVEQHWQILMGKRKKHQSVKLSKGDDGYPLGSSPSGYGDGADGAHSGEKAKRTRQRGGNTPRWTEEEEKHLLQLRDELGERNWTGIAERLAIDRPRRSAAGVEQHWQIMAGKRRRSTPSSGSVIDDPGRAAAIQGYYGQPAQPAVGLDAPTLQAELVVNAVVEEQQPGINAAPNHDAPVPPPMEVPILDVQAV